MHSIVFFLAFLPKITASNNVSAVLFSGEFFSEAMRPPIGQLIFLTLTWLEVEQSPALKVGKIFKFKYKDDNIKWK
jgi:hypothetical protein